MLKVDGAKWGESADTLREQAVKAEHPRTRERFMALYEISQGKNATQVAVALKRRPHTVMGWVHAYNRGGGPALQYQRSGGRRPLFLPR